MFILVRVIAIAMVMRMVLIVIFDYEQIMIKRMRRGRCC
jgi:hypothetical protein